MARKDKTKQELALEVDQLKRRVEAAEKLLRTGGWDAFAEQAAEYVTATNALAGLFAKKTSRKEYLDAVVGLLCEWSGCRCAGVRLVNAQGFIPYESYVGFSTDFWRHENMLNLNQDQCACIRVMTGRPEEQDGPLMTAYGSFVCHNTTAFVAGLGEAERARFRGACMREGFASVYIVPLRYRREIVGAIHLADEREGRTPAETIEFLESMSPLVAEAVHRFDVEDALNVSEGYNRLLLESSQDCIYHLSLEGRVMDLNAAGYALNEYDKPGEVLGRNCGANVVENQEALRDAVGQAAHGETARLVCKSATKSGRQIWWDCKLTPVRNADGVIGSILMIARDVTVSRQDEEALRKSHELFERLFSNIHILMAYLDTDFNFIRVNDAYAKVEGRAASFFAGKNHFALYPNRENEEIFKRVRDTGEAYVVAEKPFEYAGHPERGTTYWDWSLQPVKSEQGEVEGLILGIVDVTGRVRTRLALAKSEARYRMLLEEASDGIVMFDTSGRILDANRKACEMTGYVRGELMGMNFADVVQPRELTRKPLKVAELAAGETVFVERAWLRKDGTRITVESNSRMVEDGVIQMILRDVTARRQTEERIGAYQEQLRVMASELSLAEERTRRQIAKDMHDQIGQTLAFCQIRLGQLKSGKGPESVRKALDEVRNAITQVIKYTRHMTFELGSPILYELGLEAAVERLSERTEEQYGLKVHFRSDENPKTVDDDMRVTLFLGVRELLTNIVKHAGARSARITISDDGELKRIMVEDDGRGFEVAETAALGKEGKGFGLFSTQERLTYLGGGFEISSTPGRGTRVTMWAPLGRREKARKETEGEGEDTVGGRS